MDHQLLNSEPERARRTLSGGVLVFRWVSFAWMASLNWVAGGFRRPLLAWAGIAAAGMFTAWLTALRGRRSREHPAVLGVDLALSMTLILLSGLVVSEGQVTGPRLFYATAYPLSTALAWGTAWGLAGTAGAATALGLALVGSRPLGGDPVVSLGRAGWLSLANGVVNYLLAGGVAGVVSRHLDRSAAQLRTAVDAAIRAREHAARLDQHKQLARAIHDSVLQALAFIHKRAREIGEDPAASREEVLRLGEIAGAQEAELRALIVREPENAPEGTRSLRDALESTARNTQGIPVTVSAVGAIWLPAGEVDELASAVRQALDNVVEHAEATRAAVFAEMEDGWVAVSIRDDGRGFAYREDQLRLEGKHGLIGSMKGRIEDLGGRMRVLTAPGVGTEIEFRVPIRWPSA